MTPESCHDSWFWLATPVAQMKTGMNRTVTTAKIMRVAKIGERAFSPGRNPFLSLVIADSKLVPLFVMYVTLRVD
jgi:hypothetical protein